MPIINVRNSIATGASAQPLAGSQYEYLPFNAMVEVGITSSVNLVLATVSSGSDILQEESNVTLGTADVFPRYPDEYTLQDVAAAGDRLKVNLRNTNAGAAVVMTSVRITPI
jgi:hypothetical protein